MAYVPPALRRKQEAAADGDKLRDDVSTHPTVEASRTKLPTIYDIQNHFWPLKEQVAENSLDSGVRGSEAAIKESCEGGVSEPQDESVSNAQPDTQATAKRELPGDTKTKTPLARETHPHSTLNGTAEDRDKLKYVLLFNDAVSAAPYTHMTMTMTMKAERDVPTNHSPLHSIRAGKMTRPSTSNQTSTSFRTRQLSNIHNQQIPPLCLTPLIH